MFSIQLTTGLRGGEGSGTGGLLETVPVYAFRCLDMGHYHIMSLIMV